MKKTFGQVLREMRRAKGVSQRELAKKVSVDFSYISKLENDRTQPPAADTIVKICNVLDVSPDELLTLTGKMPSDIKEMFNSKPEAMKFIRTAKSLDLTEHEWKELTNKLRNLRS